MSIKPIIFFLFLFLGIYYLYFNSQWLDTFHKYFSFIILIIGIGSVFVYPNSKKIFECESLKSIKKTLVKKYKKKSK